MNKFPLGAYKALFINPRFLKRQADVVKRLVDTKDNYFFDALFRLDKLFLGFNPCNQVSMEPIFDDPYNQVWDIFLDQLVFCSEQFCNGKAKEFRGAQSHYKNIIFDIYQKSQELADLIRLEEVYGEKWGLDHRHDVHPIRLLDSAVSNRTDETAYRYKNWVQPELIRAKSFGLKYYPSIPDILDEISQQYADNEAIEVLHGMAVPHQISPYNFFLKLFFTSIQHSINTNILPESIIYNKVIRAVDWSNIFTVSLNDDGFIERKINEYIRKSKR